MIVVVTLVAVGVAIVLGPWCVARPARTILPLYAGSLPVASAVKLNVPLPSPFNTLSSLLGGAVIVASLAHLLIYRGGRVPTLPVALWLGFLAWASLTALWALNGPDAFRAVLVAAPLVLLVVVVSALPVDGTDFDVLRVALIMGGIVVGMYALFLLVSQRALPTHGVDQRFSITSAPQDTNPNILAASLLLPLAVSVERVALGGTRWWTARTWRGLGAAGAFFSFLAIAFTGSRGGVIAAMVSFVAALLLCRRVPGAKDAVRRVVLSTIAAVLGMGLVAVLGSATSRQGVIGRIVGNDSLRRLTSSTNGSSGRTDIWTAGYHACLAHCAVGAGLGNFPNAYDEAFAFSGAAKNVGQDRDAHDIYLQIAVETGLIGFTLFLLALICEWRVLARRGVTLLCPALGAGLVGILTANVFLSATWFKYFWLVFVVIRVAEGAGAPGVAGSSGLAGDRAHPVPLAVAT